MKKTTKMLIAGIAIGGILEGINVIANPYMWKKRKIHKWARDNKGISHEVEIDIPNIWYFVGATYVNDFKDLKVTIKN